MKAIKSPEKRKNLVPLTISGFQTLQMNVSVPKEKLKEGLFHLEPMGDRDHYIIARSKSNSVITIWNVLNNHYAGWLADP